MKSDVFFQKKMRFFWQKFCRIKKCSYLCHAEKNKHGVVVQLVRIPACHAGGREFESRPYREKERISNDILSFFVLGSVRTRDPMSLLPGGWGCYQKFASIVRA